MSATDVTHNTCNNTSNIVHYRSVQANCDSKIMICDLTLIVKIVPTGLIERKDPRHSHDRWLSGLPEYM